MKLKCLNLIIIAMAVSFCRDAWFAIGDICSATTLRGLLPGKERTIEIPAAVSPDGSSLHIVSSHILPEQEIEFEADIRN